jgi:hypothetical protein
MSIEDWDRDPHGFHLILHTLLAVPGPTSHLSSDWHNKFVELRNQTPWGGDGNRTLIRFDGARSGY